MTSSFNNAFFVFATFFDFFISLY